MKKGTFMLENTVFIELGGNLNDRLTYISDAKRLITQLNCEIIHESSVYETPPWGFKASKNFYNQIIVTKTDLNPINLIMELQKIEEKLGRVRTAKKYASRTIDLDVLFFNSDIITNDTITIPHPRLHLRKFVLIPMCEIAPHYIHPVSNISMQQLLAQCPDESSCVKVSE